jgi:hypothetical protein
MMDALCAALICNELRSQSVHDTFQKLFSGHFRIRKVPMKDMDECYRSKHIQIYLLQRLRQPAPDAFWPPEQTAHTGVPGQGQW